MVINKGHSCNVEDMLLNKWNIREVYSIGEYSNEAVEQTETLNVTEQWEPEISIFKNEAQAIELLDRHIKANSRIVFHTDVDVDGFGSTYILKKFCNYLGSNNHMLLINKEKIHGIQQKHVDYFNEKQCVDLIIITDSSTNNIDILKQFKCDVLVIDHHELENNTLQTDSLQGYCNDNKHRYVIVNNTIANDSISNDKEWAIQRIKDSAIKDKIQRISKFSGDRGMSCAVVIYEILRLYSLVSNVKDMLENSKLIQWAGVTLFTDVIDTLNKRNQWYLDRTVFSDETEITLKTMLNTLNKYKYSLDKTYIQYTFAPLINKAIRAGKGSEALGIVMNNPTDIDSLKVYSDMQAKAIEKAIYIESIDEGSGDKTKIVREFTGDTITLDTTALDVHENYNGVIAGRLSGDYHKNSAVYKRIQDKCKGSFRGTDKNIDYRRYFLEYGKGIKAQGHTGAFGFELSYEQLMGIMNSISSIEKTKLKDNKAFLTVGDMDTSEYGTYHIDDFNTFKKGGWLYKIAIGNSKVITADEILIRVKANELELINVKESEKCNIYTYKVLGLTCKAFQEIKGIYCDIYLEFTNQIDAYIRNV